MAQGNINVVDFDEAIKLMNVGAYGFTFNTSRDGKFKVQLDHSDPPHLVLVEVNEEEQLQ